MAARNACGSPCSQDCARFGGDVVVHRLVVRIAQGDISKPFLFNDRCDLREPFGALAIGKVVVGAHPQAHRIVGADFGPDRPNRVDEDAGAVFGTAAVFVRPPVGAR